MMNVIVSSLVALSGVYTVPRSQGLESFATIPLAGIEARVPSDGPVSIVYQIPEELVGPGGTKVHLEGYRSANATTFSAMSGDSVFGRGFCSIENETTVTCEVAYEHMLVDNAAAKLFLEKKYEGLEELEARKKIADRFSVDPVGVIRFELP